MDALEGLKRLPDNSVHCIVTSPPYWGLRDYGVAGQLGLEETPKKYVSRMVKVFRECRRVLREDGTLWLNLGDSYAAQPKHRTIKQSTDASTLTGGKTTQTQILKQPNKIVGGLKPKDLVGIPWMVAFALRDSGWYLRSEIIWYKKAVMPESVTDRPTKCHEQLFLLSKSDRYHYDYEAIMEDAVYDLDGTGTIKRKLRQHDGSKSQPTALNNGMRKVYPDGKHGDSHQSAKTITGKRNKRDVWEVNPYPFAEAHFAVFPEKLIVDCIKAGSPEGGVVLDPFMGAGTTALVAAKLNRKYVGFELNPEYVQIAEKRLQKELGLFMNVPNAQECDATDGK